MIVELKVVEAAAQRLAFRVPRYLKRQVVASLGRACWTTATPPWPIRETEQFRVLYLDRKNILIADEEQAKGTVDHVPVYPREVAKRALELNASGADPRAQPPFWVIRAPSTFGHRHDERRSPPPATRWGCPCMTT